MTAQTQAAFWIRGRRRPRWWRSCAAVGVLGFLTAFVGSWAHSLWFDELATVSAARRSLPEMFDLLQSVDLVHGLYYLFIHFWAGVFGYSELSLRFPSAVAVALACAGTVRIGQLLVSNFVGVTAGVVLAVLPRMVWAGSEARQYAFTALVAVVLTLLLIKAWRRNRIRDWVAYSAVALLGVASFMFFAFVVAAHVVASVALHRRLRSMLITASISGLVASPFILATLTQKGQVSWIERRTPVDALITVFFRQFFKGDDRPDKPPALIMACLVGLAVALVCLAAAGALRALAGKGDHPLATISLSLVVVPVVLLLALHYAVVPSYEPRYLTYAAPGFALLVALGIERLKNIRPAWVGAAAGVVALALALVPLVALKGPIGQPSDTARGIAETVAAEVQPPVGIVYQSPESRSVSVGYPEAFRGLADLTLTEPVNESGTLWGVDESLEPAEVSGMGRVWLVGVNEDVPADLALFHAAGCVRFDATVSKRLTLIGFDC